MKLRDKCEADVAFSVCPHCRQAAGLCAAATEASFFCPAVVRAVRNYRRRVSRRARKAAPV